MPAWLRAEDEDKWDKAKAAAKESYPDMKEDDDRYWAIVTSIFKKIGGKAGKKSLAAPTMVVAVGGYDPLFKSERPSVTEQGDKLYIRTPYHTGFIGDIRDIPGRRWDPDRKVWIVGKEHRERVDGIIGKHFREEEHPRAPAGLPEGGQFVPKEGIGAKGQQQAQPSGGTVEGAKEPPTQKQLDYMGKLVAELRQDLTDRRFSPPTYNHGPLPFEKQAILNLSDALEARQPSQRLIEYIDRRLASSLLEAIESMHDMPRRQASLVIDALRSGSLRQLAQAVANTPGYSEEAFEGAKRRLDARSVDIVKELAQELGVTLTPSDAQPSKSLRLVLKGQLFGTGVPTIYIVRHGKTHMNGEGEQPDLVRGWLDPPLDEKGKDEANRLAKVFDSVPLTKVYTSDLKRSEETAKVIAAETSAPIEVSRAFRPWNLGRLQGSSSRQSTPTIRKFAGQNPTTPVPDGESFEDFKHRFLDGLKGLMDDLESGKPRSVVIVTHYRNLKLAHAWAADGGKAEKVDVKTFLADDMPTGYIGKLTYEGGKWHFGAAEAQIDGAMPEAKKSVCGTLVVVLPSKRAPGPRLVLKGHKLHYQTDFQGISVSVENRKGSIRRGKQKGGKEWEMKMFYLYGRIPYTKGKDGEAVDCFIGPNKESQKVFVIHQRTPDGKHYDEDKCMLGFDDEEHARDAFLAHYDSQKFLGEITEMGIDKFKEKLSETRESPKMIKSLPQQIIVQKWRKIKVKDGLTIRVPGGPPVAPKGKCYKLVIAEGAAIQCFARKADAARAARKMNGQDLCGFSYVDIPTYPDGRKVRVHKAWPEGSRVGSSKDVHRALKEMGHEVITGKGGFHIRGKGFVSLAQARRMTGIKAPKRNFRGRIGPYGDLAWVAAINRVRVGKALDNPIPVVLVEKSDKTEGMTIRIKHLTPEQKERIANLMGPWQWMGHVGTSRPTVFFADGDRDFGPQVEVDGARVGGLTPDLGKQYEAHKGVFEV